MARPEMRAAVSGAPVGEDRPTPSSRRTSKRKATAPQKDLENAETQAAILRPARLSFALPSGREMIVPLEFTVKDVLDRGVFEDMNAFARQVGVELGRISPELESVGAQIVLAQCPGYLEAAFLRSGVKRSVRELLTRIAHIEGERSAADRLVRPTLSDLEEMNDGDYIICALRLYVDALTRLQKAKNAARTASA